MKGSLLVLICLLALWGCTRFPQIDAAEGERVATADYPRLVPLDQLLDAPDSQITDDTETPILARLARLQARAAAIRSRTVIDRATRVRMERGVQAPQ